MGVALSTSWNAFRYSEAAPCIREIKELGFDEVELSFNLTPRMVDEIEKLVARNQISVGSVHNYCPIPENLKRAEALPDCYSLSSPNEEERNAAVSFTKRSIDTAVRMRARAVVLHAGRVAIPDRISELIGFFSQGLSRSSEFSGLRMEIIEERMRFQRKYFDNALRSLETIERYARENGIFVGIENRFYYREIPSLDEIGEILSRFDKSNIRYWHDVGHAFVMERLGFSGKDEYLQRYGASILGIHLHDINGCVDHGAPGTGEFDFNRIKPYVGQDTIKVVEAHHPVTAEEVRNSRKFIEDLFAG
ncbi:MAG: sugar phosphate isomerase/epimerase [Candidatus Omnitrophica bacterium]|nr:sugar phosphate isomerase/epimerase [Candidatus Omnitrophota bacterium]